MHDYQTQGQVFGGTTAGIGLGEGSGALTSANYGVWGINAARYPQPLRPSTSTGGKRLPVIAIL